MGLMIPAPGARRTAARILWRVRLLALGDRNPEFLTHREIDSTLKLLPADVECRWGTMDAALSAISMSGCLRGHPGRPSPSTCCNVLICPTGD
jgi:hypothetical protein